MKRVLKVLSLLTLTILLMLVDVNICNAAQSYTYKKIVEKDVNKLQITEEITQYILNKYVKEDIQQTQIQTENIPQEETTFEVQEQEQETKEPEYNVTQEEGTLYANTSVNVRELPNANATRLGALSYGQEIQKTGVCDNGWTQVNFKGSTAYVNSKYLQDSKPEVITYNNDNNNNNDNDKEEESSQQIQTSGIIKTDGSVSASRIRTIENYYYKVPQNIRTRLESNGWTYLCTSEKFGAKYGYNYKILALTVYDDKIIYIDNRKSAENAITHECGHAFDYMCGFISDTQEFINAFNAERQTFCSVHSTHKNNTSTPLEYFAEFFSVMCENPSSVKDACPQTYQIINNAINSF